jgi:hypothetical protein
LTVFIANDSIIRCQCVAFFTDCEHEILPVKSGYRVTLTYHLFYGDEEDEEENTKDQEDIEKGKDLDKKTQDQEVSEQINELSLIEPSRDYNSKIFEGILHLENLS